MTITEYKNECYKMAREKGFWASECEFCGGQGKIGNGTSILDCSECNKGQISIDRNTGELLMLVVSELGEAIEAHRKKKFANLSGFERDMEALEDELSEDKDGVFQAYFEDKIKDTYEDEIADAIIRLLDLCGGQEIDIEFFIDMKMKYNSFRERRHGKSY
jgi:NTP pyrophosphatase (non-canonical NTP hydrolase)